jgi:hypothetical protein
MEAPGNGPFRRRALSIIGPRGNEVFKSDLAIIKSDVASLKSSMVRLQWAVGFNMVCCFYLVAKAYLP